MTWHLKDKRIEEKLIELDSNFLENLNEAMYQFSLHENEDDEDLIGVDMEIYRYPRLITAQLQIEKTDIEDIQDYNPNDWNEYPKVTPPENILMRVEAVGRSGVFRDCAIFKDGVWQSDMDGEACGEYYAKVKRFRPWED